MSQKRNRSRKSRLYFSLSANQEKPHSERKEKKPHAETALILRSFRCRDTEEAWLWRQADFPTDRIQSCPFHWEVTRTMGKTKELAQRIEEITFSLVTEIPAFSQNGHRGQPRMWHRLTCSLGVTGGKILTAVSDAQGAGPEWGLQLPLVKLMGEVFLSRHLEGKNRGNEDTKTEKENSPWFGTYRHTRTQSHTVYTL